MDVFKDPLGFDQFEPGSTDEQKAEFDRFTTDHERLLLDFKNCFETDAGKRVLDHLREMTVENATWKASLGYQEAIAHGFAREGQNAMYRYVRDLINQGAEVMRNQQKVNNV